jgi:hypothetical protein
MPSHTMTAGFGHAALASTPPSRRVTAKHRIAAALLSLLVLAAGLRFGLAMLFPNFFRPDEIFQTLEPAHRLVTGWGLVTWEWREGIRSWMFPGFLAGLMQVAAWIGLEHDGTIRLITAVLTVPGLAIVAAAFALGWQQQRVAGALICGVLLTIWPDLVYFGPKTLTEIQAGHLLAIAVCLASLAPSLRMSQAWLCAGVGLLLGLVFCLRFQLAPALLPVAIAAGRTEWRRRWAPMVVAGLIPVAAMGLIDLWMLGSPFQSIWKNFQLNLIEGRSLNYGVKGPLWYLQALLANWGMGFAVLGLCFAIGARRVPAAASAAVLVLLVHSVVAHKEYSFIYAAIPLILITAGLGMADIVARLSHGGMARRRFTLYAVTLSVALALAATCGGGYRQGAEAGSVNLRMMSVVRGLPDMCGLALYNAGWPSYAVIDRKVMTYLPQSTAEISALRHAANYILVGQNWTSEVPWARIRQCDSGLCLMHSPTTCTEMPDLEANTVHARDGF